MTALRADRPVAAAPLRSASPSSHALRPARRRSELPVEQRLPRHLGSALTFAFFTAIAGVGLWQGGHLESFVARYGAPHHAAARLVGLGLEKVVVTGLAQMRESEVLESAGLDWRVSLPFLSVEEVRRRLEDAPLVESASVRKLYPNELSIALVERKPHALWQRNGELFVISADGTVIDFMDDPRFTDLPLVVGEKANLRNQEFMEILEAAGPLRSRIRAGALISGRRWDLKMENGLDVYLPERNAVDAVRRLAALERENAILEKDVLTVDLRMADRVVVRLTEQAALARAEALKNRKTRGKGVDT